MDSVPTPRQRLKRIAAPGVGWFKPLVFLLCLYPLVFLVFGAFNDLLGANPVEAMIRGSGDWALYFLLMTLAVTPLRKLSGWHWLIRYRRMLGLFAFFYACMHFLAYIWFDRFFDLEEILGDIVKRPFITVGFVCLLLLLPLAATSTQGMMQRLKKNWKRLHRLVYPVSMLAVLHYFMMTRADYKQPLMMALLLVLLLGYRLAVRFKAR